MKPNELIQLQICLEYQLDQQGLLVPFPESSEQAFYIAYRYTNGYKSFISQALSLETRQQLLKLEPADIFTHPIKVRNLISVAHRPCQGGEMVFWSGNFIRRYGAEEYPEVSQEGDAWVIKCAGQISSCAVSVRENERCAEVYVETHPDHRLQGYARQVVAAWANGVLNSGRVAFYSYCMTNVASAALARSLGVEWYADAITFEASLSSRAKSG